MMWSNLKLHNKTVWSYLKATQVNGVELFKGYTSKTVWDYLKTTQVNGVGLFKDYPSKNAAARCTARGGFAILRRFVRRFLVPFSKARPTPCPPFVNGTPNTLSPFCKGGNKGG